MLMHLAFCPPHLDYCYTGLIVLSAQGHLERFIAMAIQATASTTYQEEQKHRTGR